MTSNVGLKLESLAMVCMRAWYLKLLLRLWYTCWLSVRNPLWLMKHWIILLQFNQMGLKMLRKLWKTLWVVADAGRLGELRVCKSV